MKRWLQLMLLVSVVITVPVFADGMVIAQIDEIEFEVTLAEDDASRRQGLMGRDNLKPNEGMLLVYPDERVIRLWMLNTNMPLDVGFFDRDLVLLSVLSMQPDGGREIHSSKKPALYALEMNQGWFERHGIRPGARLNLPLDVKGR